MLLVDRLARDAEGFGDGLPRPPEDASIVDVQLFEFLHQLTQRRHGGETDGRVAAVHRIVQTGQVTHLCQLTLTRPRVSTTADTVMWRLGSGVPTPRAR